MAKTYVETLLGENEKILLTSRQHWFILFGSVVLESFLILLLIALIILVVIFFPQFMIFAIPVGVFLLIIPLVGMTRDILTWWNRQFIITNLRVIQIAGVFNKDVTDSSLEKVNDVKMEQSTLGRIFDFGDIEILTASELGVNLFRKIENPVRFKTTMLNAKERLEHGGVRFPEEGIRKSDVPNMIAQLDQLRQRGVITEEEFQKKKTDLLSKI
jgi:membrane protein YdbS with pleckstrin-like domain